MEAAEQGGFPGCNSIRGGGVNVVKETEELEITAGDVVHIRKGVNHWHGARAESYMSHITITAV